MTASWVRNRVNSMPETNSNTTNTNENSLLCQFYENFEKQGNDADIPLGIYDLDELKELGRSRGWCPYFLTRRAINRANIIVYNYQYMLDPKVSNLVSRELEQESIVVFDEAHNIDNVCIEALSVTIDKRALDNSSRSIGRLQSKVSEMKASNSQRLVEEYQALVSGLTEQGMFRNSSADMILANPVLPDDIMQVILFIYLS